MLIELNFAPLARSIDARFIWDTIQLVWSKAFPRPPIQFGRIGHRNHPFAPLRFFGFAPPLIVVYGDSRHQLCLTRCRYHCLLRRSLQRPNTGPPCPRSHRILTTQSTLLPLVGPRNSQARHQVYDQPARNNSIAFVSRRTLHVVGSMDCRRLGFWSYRRSPGKERRAEVLAQVEEIGD